MPTAQSSADVRPAEAASAALKVGRVAGAVAIAVVIFASLYFAVLYFGAQ